MARACVRACRWVLSTASKDGADDGIAKYNGKWAIEDSGKENTALVATVSTHRAHK